MKGREFELEAGTAGLDILAREQGATRLIASKYSFYIGGLLAGTGAFLHNWLGIFHNQEPKVNIDRQWRRVFRQSAD